LGPLQNSSATLPAQEKGGFGGKIRSRLALLKSPNKIEKVVKI